MSPDHKCTLNIGLHVKCPLLLPDFNETWILSTDFQKISNLMKIPFSMNGAVPCGQTDRQIWRSFPPPLPQFPNAPTTQNMDFEKNTNLQYVSAAAVNVKRTFFCKMLWQQCTTCRLLVELNVITYKCQKSKVGKMSLWLLFCSFAEFLSLGLSRICSFHNVRFFVCVVECGGFRCAMY